MKHLLWLIPLMLTAADRLTVEDVFQMESALDPQISPDGKRVVYMRRFADIMSDQRYSNLWIVNVDGSGHQPLTSGNYTDTTPRWSPDSSQIVYVSNREGSAEIHRRWMETGQTARITRLSASGLSSPAGISWSPDGKSVAFTAHLQAEDPKIIQLPKAPEGAKWAVPARVVDQLVYRYNGAGYLKTGHTQLFVVPSEGGTPRQISKGKYQHGGTAWASSEPFWTPDGQHLILSANRHDNYQIEPLNSEVYEFRVSDGTVRALTARNGPDNAAALSPDGRRIAYIGFDDKRQGYQLRRLSVMSRDGSGSRVLTATLDRDVASPVWSPDSQGLFFFSDDRGNTGLHYVPLDGPIKKIAADLGSGMGASGGGATLSIAKNGSYAVTTSQVNRPGDIAVSVTGGALRTLTAVNEDVFAGKKLGIVEEIWYDSSKDGRKVQGWIIKPPDFDPSKKYPMILEIHGGPFANYGTRFDFEKQLMAASGYVVVYTNPRGSTSYGQEFGNLIHHAYPGDDFFDLNSGVDAVVAKGYIDPQRLYVTGGSGGGVLTCWMIGRTTRFRAAVTVYPVINWYSFVLTSDIGNWTHKYWFPGLPWDHVEHYEKRSLLSVVKNVKTPTMVLTGEEDWRTPMSDSEQYYQALQLLGIETVLVRVPGEPHGINVRPSHHMSKILHILEWFNKRGGKG